MLRKLILMNRRRKSKKISCVCFMLNPARHRNIQNIAGEDKDFADMVKSIQQRAKKRRNDSVWIIPADYETN